MKAEQPHIKAGDSGRAPAGQAGRSSTGALRSPPSGDHPSRFTPGPWNVQLDGQIWSDDHPIAGKIIAGPWGDEAVDFVTGEHFLAHHWGTVACEEAKANAHLIAAAPELYEALEIVASCGAVDPANTAIVVGHDASTVLQQAWTALRKARGDQ